jgi:AcrR family transcriptional regulator
MTAAEKKPARARTQEQKSNRRLEILEAADRHFRQVGFEAFSMGELARCAGVAKGTLYLYFKTREEVLLELYCQQLQGWTTRLLALLETPLDDDAFSRGFLSSARTDPTFLPLISRLDSVIEHNISLEKLVDSKRLMIRLFAQLTPVLERSLNLPEGSGFPALSALSTLLLGACQIDAGPSLENELLPKDVRQLVDSFASDDIFLPSARHILSGVRASN